MFFTFFNVSAGPFKMIPVLCNAFLLASTVLDGGQTCQLGGLGQPPAARAHPDPSSPG